MGNIYQTTPKSESELVERTGGYADVRDIAEISALVLASENSSNERYLTVAGMDISGSGLTRLEN